MDILIVECTDKASEVLLTPAERLFGNGKRIASLLAWLETPSIGLEPRPCHQGISRYDRLTEVHK